MHSIPAAPGLGDVEHFRPWYRSYVRPPSYLAWGHLVIVATSLFLAGVFAVSRIRSVTALELVTIPVWLVLGSAFVYWFHKHVLHRPTRFFYFAYRKHTLEHHRFFDYEHITRDEFDDLHAMLFPYYTAPILCTLSYGVSLLLTPVLGSNVAHLSMLMMIAYFAAYEFVHTVDHLPDQHILARLPILRFLREHHRLHHDPALMGKYNFNIVIPLFDPLLGAFTRSRPSQRP